MMGKLTILESSDVVDYESPSLSEELLDTFSQYGLHALHGYFACACVMLAHAHSHTHMHTRTPTCTLAHPHAHSHTHMHTRTPMHSHTHARGHAHASKLKV